MNLITFHELFLLIQVKLADATLLLASNVIHIFEETAEFKKIPNGLLCSMFHDFVFKALLVLVTLYIVSCMELVMCNHQVTDETQMTKQSENLRQNNQKL